MICWLGWPQTQGLLLAFTGTGRSLHLTFSFLLFLFLFLSLSLSFFLPSFLPFILSSLLCFFLSKDRISYITGWPQNLHVANTNDLEFQILLPPNEYWFMVHRPLGIEQCTLLRGCSPSPQYLLCIYRNRLKSKCTWTSAQPAVCLAASLFILSTAFIQAFFMAEGSKTYLLQLELSLNCLVSTYCWGFLAEFRAYAYYISRHGLTRNGQGKSAVCMVTSMNRISTWDIHEVSLADK